MFSSHAVFFRKLKMTFDFLNGMLYLFLYILYENEYEDEFN